MGVLLHAAAEDSAVQHVEGGEQGGRAVALVVVGHGLAAPRLDGQPGLGAVEGLDLALFVKREDHGMGWRIDIEADNVGELVGKARIARTLEGRMRCGCRSWACQMRCTERSEIAIVLAIARPVQWVAW